MWLEISGEKRQNDPVEAGVRQLRDHLSRYLDAVRGGAEVVVTEHGRAVARLVPLDRPRVFDQLVAEGVITPAAVPKRERRRPVVEDNAGTVSDLVADERR